MRTNVLAPAVLAFALFAPTAPAGVSYTGWVNGLGYAQLDYTLTCTDGTMITRSVSGLGISGSDACPDASNSLTWEFGVLWHRDVRATDRKQAPGVGVGNGDANRSPIDLVDSGVLRTPRPHWSAQYAIVRLDSDRPPQFPDGPMNLDEMLSNAIITSDNILLFDSVQGDAGGPFSHQIGLPPSIPDDHVFIVTWMESDPGPCVIADLNNSGNVDFFDYLVFAQFFNDADPRADVNNDDVIDFFDYLYFVDAFSQCI